MQKTLSIYTLGCRVNHYESEVIADSARALGYEIVDWSKPADIAIINSCALTVLAQAKTRQIIRNFARANPESSIAVTGCYAQTDPQNFEQLPNVKWVVGNALKSQTVKILAKNPPLASLQKFLSPAIDADSEIMNQSTPLEDRFNLKIQDGCDNACSYCIIPRARGLPKSRNFDDIVADAKNLVSRGVREIIITGINISKFISNKCRLDKLLDELNDIDNLLRIRIGSIEPPDFQLEALLERVCDKSHKLMPHFHISAQSLADNVLQAMRRKYEVKEFLDIVEKIKSADENIAIGTDLICGHPFETQADFDLTKDRLQNSGISYAHVFTFSPRPKTLAAIMKNTVDPNIGKQRADDLRKVAKLARDNFIKGQLHTTKEVLLENKLSNGEYLAYTDNYIQINTNIDADGLKNKLALVELISESGKDRIKAEFKKLL